MPLAVPSTENSILSRLSLRQLFLLAVVGGLLIPALLASVFGYRVQRDQLVERFGHEQQRMLEIVSFGMQEPLWNLNRQSGSPLLESVMDDKRVLSVQVYDTLSGTPFLSSQRENPQAHPGAVFERPVVHRGETIGVVRIAFDTRHLDEMLERQLVSLLMIVLAQLVVSILLIIAILNSRFLRPMQQLSAQAGELAALRLDQAFEWHRQDELGAVGRHLEWARIELRRLLGELGEKTRALQEDIRHRREVEEALRRSEGKYRELFHSSLDGILICDAEGQVIDANPAFLAMTGYSAEQLRRLGFWPLLAAGSEQGEARRLHEEVWVRGYCDEYETEYVDRLGRHFPVSVKAVATRDDSSGAAGVWRMVRDITSQREAKARLQLAGKVFDNTAEGILITDASGVIRSANRALTRISGYSEQEMVGRTPAMFASGQQDAAFYQQMWQQLLNEGQWQGELTNRRRSGELYPQWLVINAVHDAGGELSHFVAVCSDESERRAADERIDYLAHFDALTGLPNRTQLQERSAVVFQQGDEACAALLLLDLDRFKTVNESLGHQAGDMLLRVAADRLAGVLDAGQIVGRQGGDEFIVLLPRLASADDALGAACRIQQALASPVEIDGHPVQASASIGISLFPQDGQDFDTLVRNADAAMYHAKGSGRGQVRFYTADLNARARERLQVEAQLRQALEAGEFVLHYQPQVDMKSGRIVGVEALVRWQHPQRGLLGPLQFIDVAEDSGLIVGIGRWVLEEACAQLARWRDEGLPPVRVGVNLSALQFRQPDLVDNIADVLERYGLDAEWLDLEVTESLVMEDLPQTTALLEAMHALGVSLSIDDFGTGYSSLAYLKRLKAGTLKIDRSFVKDLPHDADDAAITRTVISMAASLNMRVVAEGVETRAQWALLAAEGCDTVQGYFCSKPVPAGDCARLLRSGNRVLEPVS